MENNTLIVHQSIGNDIDIDINLHYIRSQDARMRYANLYGHKFGFVERTRETNKVDGPCPHYLPRIAKSRFAKWHQCDACGKMSSKPIKPYEV